MSNLSWGLQMTVVGMGTVFLLLILLMVVLLLIGRMDRQPAGRDPAAAAVEAAPTDAAPGEPAPAEAPHVRVLADGLTDEQLAAVTVAVITHTRVRRGQAAPAMRSSAPGSHLWANRWVGIGRAQQQQNWQRR